MALASGSADPHLESAFVAVRREDFLPPGPWRIGSRGHWLQTPSDDPTYVYQNCLVALDEARAINSGEPFLHAAWLSAVRPNAGDLICHIGSGLRYYTAVLAKLAMPAGRVTAFKIEEYLAAGARENLKRFRGVELVHGDAAKLALPDADLIYVNAGVAAPPVSWLRALRPDGWMIFPWRPSESVALTLLVTRHDDGFEAKALMPAWFTPCVGASDSRACVRTPDTDEARNVRSVWISSECLPNASAVAVFPDVWFSTDSVG